MAPTLQCPECGARQPLDEVAHRSAFPCAGCARLLKVPERHRRAARAGPPGSPVGAAPAPPPSVPQAPPAESRAGVRNASEPETLSRLLVAMVWIVALPAGFVVVFGVAGLTGLLTSGQLSDVYLRTDWSRFWPIARLLPFVALVIALMVHFGVLGLLRWRRAALDAAGRSARPPARGAEVDVRAPDQDRPGDADAGAPGSGAGQAPHDANPAGPVRTLAVGRPGTRRPPRSP